MARSLLLSLALASLFIGMVSARDWNILNQLKGVKPATTTTKTSQNRIASLKGPNLNGYCESWRVNVELHNIRDFKVVPQECVWFVQKYMTSSQYEDDVGMAVDEAILYLGKTCCEKKKCDGMDAWIFDIDDTLLSTIPYHKSYGSFGGEQLNTTMFEEWQSWGNAPALPNMVKLFHEIRERGFKIFLVSSRKEYLRSATVENLIEAGYHGWSNLLLRGEEEEKKSISHYKADVREWLTSLGYRVWGVMGAQWNSFAGCPVPKRTFKLPNSIYYIA
uniref:Acid phosphatase 1 n=1 Tax=Noccaea caerulescens TaxID=107243 RepID=A0A1J3FJU0_NOCCA